MWSRPPTTSKRAACCHATRVCRYQNRRSPACDSHKPYERAREKNGRSSSMRIPWRVIDLSTLAGLRVYLAQKKARLNTRLNSEELSLG